MAFASPSEGATVSGRVPVKVSVDSGADVRKVRLFVGGRLLANDFRAPYAFTWNTNWVAAGNTYTLTAVAYGRTGVEIAHDSIQIKVGEPSPAPLRSFRSVQLTASTFADLQVDDPYADAIGRLAEAGVVAGFEDGSFRSGATVTRAQLAKMMARTLGIADEGVAPQNPFEDLGLADADSYPHKYVALLHSVGAVEGIQPGQFSPWMTATRAQVVTIMVRAVQTVAPGSLAKPPAEYVSSVGTFDPDHDYAMAVAEYNGLLEGLEGYGPSYEPWAPASRGEIAQLLSNLVCLN